MAENLDMPFAISGPEQEGAGPSQPDFPNPVPLIGEHVAWQNQHQQYKQSLLFPLF